MAGLLAGSVALASMATSAPLDPSLFPIHTELALTLRAHVEVLAHPELNGRKPGTAGNRRAAEYIRGQLQEAGLSPLPSLGGYAQSLPRDLGDNLLGARPTTATGLHGRWILIGAHFDHLGGTYLGADDNASGVAILLELAKRLPALTHHPVLFAAFNAEEPPYIRTSSMGSQYLVNHLPPEIGSTDAFQAVLIMDIMGGAHWAPLRDVIFATGAEKSPGLYARLKQAASSGPRTEGPGLRQDSATSVLSPDRVTPHASRITVVPVGIHLVEQIPYLGQVSFSDYDAFRNAGVPFVFFSAGRTPRYHDPTDLPEMLHYERMAATVEWLAEWLIRLDKDVKPYDFVPDRIEFADEVAAFLPLVPLAAEPASMIPGTSALSRWRLRRDAEWLASLTPAHEPSFGDLTRLERLSIRLQCLLADFPGCFLF